MKKRGLKDVKRRNRQVVLESVMEAGSLSRVEIAQNTGLAASTVSTLVSELLSEGLLTEAGTVGTAGRSRTELAIDPHYGSIAVVEIGRNAITASYFDMTLTPLKTAVLSRRYVSGNDLLELISTHFQAWQGELPPIAGIGLLFQEDMRESDFRVIYSTGSASASITLKDALLTQYRVPVEEEFSVAYTVSDALSQEATLKTHSSAHISIGTRVLAQVTVEGRSIPLRDRFCQELSQAMAPQTAGMDPSLALQHYLAELICLLCMLFPLDAILLSTQDGLSKAQEQQIQSLVRERLSPEALPKIKFLHPSLTRNGDLALARQVRKKALLAH